MAETKDTHTGSEESVNEAAVDRVREILVGAPMRELAAQLRQTEARLGDKIANVQQAAESQLQHMEACWRRELSASSDEYRRLREHSDATFAAVEKSHREMREELRERINGLEQPLAAAAIDLWGQLEARIVGVLDRLDNSQRGLTEVVVREAHKLLEHERFHAGVAKLVRDLVREGQLANLGLAAPTQTGGNVTPEERERMIRKLAYSRAEQRGFAPGNAEHDWHAAEAEVERVLALVAEVKEFPLTEQP